MMHASLSDNVLVEQDIPTQIASANVNGTVIDTQGWDGCLFVFNIGTMASGATFDARIMSSLNSNFSGNANVTGTVAGVASTAAAIAQVPNTSNNNVAMIDVFRPTQRYLKSATQPATANSTFGSTAILYRRTGALPPTQATTTLPRIVCIQN